MSNPSQAGRLKYFIDKWFLITSDTWILSTISGYKIDFVQTPVQFSLPSNIPFLPEEMEAVSIEISTLLEKEAIMEISREQCKFISTIFTIRKKFGDVRPIINLKNLNSFVRYEHFKMENISLLKELIHTDDFLTSIDLKDAYFSVAIHPDFQGYLSFFWGGHYFAFQCLPFGLSSAPMVSTKVMKPVAAAIRSKGIRILIYLDDILILACTCQEGREHTKYVFDVLTDIGFIVNIKKSCLNPQKAAIYFGFEIDTLHMTISLPQDKVNRIRSKGESLLKSEFVKIRNFASFIGSIVSSFFWIPRRQVTLQKS